MVDFDDKRDFYRMMLNTDVTVTIIDDEANSKLMATCRDLSATGLAIEMSHPLDIDTHVRIKVASANQGVQSLDIFGKVIRIKEESSECYLIGITIEEID